MLQIILYRIFRTFRTFLGLGDRTKVRTFKTLHHRKIHNRLLIVIQVNQDLAFRKPDEMTVLCFGKTGVGKSSTLNSLFGLNWANDNAVACNKEPHIAYLDRSHYAGYPKYLPS
jgi:predicted GTPase